MAPLVSASEWGIAPWEIDPGKPPWVWMVRRGLWKAAQKNSATPPPPQSDGEVLQALEKYGL